jgi:RHS repeat-associated protein
VRAETLVNGKLESTGAYRYDSLGRRVAKVSEVNGKTEQKHFLWQGLRMLREERPGQSSLYLYEPGSYAPLARVDQAEGEERRLYYFHTDQIGTPLEMTDANGSIVWQATYKAWGAVERLAFNDVEQNLRFQGQYFDDETGLHYNTFRYYDPEVGRFVTQDPIGLLGGENLYKYALNAQMWIDPLGLANRPNNGQYNIFHDHTLDPQYRYSSDSVQFNRANTDLLSRMEANPEFRKDMLNRYPKLDEWAKSGNKSISPPDLTWHHHEDVNRLSLVDRVDHRSNHALYHPTGKGGRDIWGGGAPGRKGKLNGATGKVCCG